MIHIAKIIGAALDFTQEQPADQDDIAYAESLLSNMSPAKRLITSARVKRLKVIEKSQKINRAVDI